MASPEITYTNGTEKLSPPLHDAVKASKCCSNSDIIVKTSVNGLEKMCSLISRPSNLDIIHQVFLVLTAVPVCLRAGVTVFVSGVQCM